MGPVTPGSGGTLQNNQCIVAGSGVAANANGGVLSLDVQVSFTSSYKGSKGVFVNVLDAAAQSSGWLPLGAWTVQ